MERIAQWLDDLDDWIGFLGLLSERIRNTLVKTVCTIGLFAVLAGGIVVATAHPPIAMAIAMLLFLSLLNKSVLNVA